MGRILYISKPGSALNIDAFNMCMADPYTYQTFDISSQDGIPTGVAISQDGKKMFMIGTVSDKVHQYSMSTPFDLTTASYDNIYLSVSAQGGAMSHIIFKSDGTKFYLVNADNYYIYQYNLTTAWDLSTASYANKSISTLSLGNYSQAFFFKPDGTFLFFIKYAGAGAIIHKRALTTAWDISTVQSTGDNFTYESFTPLCICLYMSPDGKAFYVNDVNFSSKRIRKYPMSTPWDITTTQPYSCEPPNMNGAYFGGQRYTVNPSNGKYVFGTNASSDFIWRLQIY